jgi:hypothetical protein
LGLSGFRTCKQSKHKYKNPASKSLKHQNSLRAYDGRKMIPAYIKLLEQGKLFHDKLPALAKRFLARECAL